MSITRINTNTDALLAGANLSKAQFDLSRTLSHLSTGLRIVTGSDDPAGTGLSATFRAQLGGITQALQNTQDGLSLMGLADSAITSNMDVLLRMRDIAVRSASVVTVTTAQRVAMEQEYISLKNEIARRSAAVKFNGKALFSGQLSGKCIQIGPDNSVGSRFSIQMPVLSVSNIQGRTLAAAHVSGNDATNALAAIDLVQSAMNGLSNIQTIIGSQEKMLERMVTDLNSEHVNMAAASSRITDADMAVEISNFAKQQVIAQSAAAMVAQANALPGAVMKTLGIF